MINPVLLNAFVRAQDHVVAGGEKFWTGAKRFPRAAELDVLAEDQHLAFVLCTANLLAAGYGISPQADGLLPPGHPQRDVEGAGMLVWYVCRGTLGCLRVDRGCVASLRLGRVEMVAVTLSWSPFLSVSCCLVVFLPCCLVVFVFCLLSFIFSL